MDPKATAVFHLGGVVGLSASVLEAVPQPLCVKDAGSVYLWASRSWADLMGIRPEWVPNSRDGELFPPDVARAHVELDLKAFSSGAPAEGEILLDAPSGPARRVQVTVAPIVAPDGKIAGLLGLAQQITDRAATDLSQDKSVRREEAISFCTRSLLMSRTSSSAIGGFLQHLGELNKIHNVTVFQNATSPEGEIHARRRYGWTDPETDGGRLAARSLPYGPHLIRWHEMLSMGLPVQGTLETLPPEERAVLADEGIQSVLLLPLEVNGQFWGLVRLADCVRSRQWDEGELRMLSVGAESLSAFLMRMQSEEALHRKIEEQEALWAGTPDFLYIKDKHSVYLAANPAFADVVGVPLDQIPGKTDFDFFPAEDARTYRESDRNIIETGETLSNLEDTYTTSSSQAIQAITTKAPLRDRTGAVAGIIGITRDITERAELERQVRQAQKMESIGTLAAGVAHDFNNLLTAILGFSHLALPKLDEGRPLHKYVSRIAGAGERAKDLVRQLLTFSRQVEAERGPVLLSPILKETIKFLRSTLPTSIEIVSSVPEETRWIEADATQMHQVAMNLCVNAAHAMAEGGTLTVRLDEIERNAPPETEQAKPGTHRWLQLTVEDTGYGMDDATKARIFEPFFTTKEAGKGTGLGLSTVYGIVKDTGGTIEVDSTPGVGTTFRVCFPVSEKAARHEAPSDEPLSQKGSETVLFVDDEPAVLELGRASLEEAGYTVLTASDGAHALSVYEQHLDEIAVLVTDTTMPRMGGPQLITHVLALRPDAKVVLCSGQAVPDKHRRPVERAGGAILMKPFVPADILTTVRRVLDA